MPLLKLADFVSAGLNNDVVSTDLPGNFLTSVGNVRAADGGVSPFGGYSVIKDMPAGFEPWDLIYIPSDIAKFWVIMGKDDIYRFESAFVSVKPTGMQTLNDPNKWTSTALSDIPVINHPSTGPLYMTQSDANFKELPFKSGQTWSQAKQVCDIMVSHKQFLFALRINDNGVEKTDAVRWSAPADVGGIPPTWDHLDTTSTAGYVTLGGTGGSIVGALPMRDALVVYRTNGITIFDFVGGRYVWRIRHLSSSVGLLSKESVVDVNGVHYFISDGDIYRNDGNSVKSIAHNRIRKTLNSINKAHYDKAYAVHNPARKEILFCIPSVASEYPDSAYVYNYVYDSWFARGLPRTNMTSYGVSIAVSTEWDKLNTDWDGFDKSWSDDSTTPFDNSLVSVMPPVGSEPAKLISIDTLLGFNKEPFRAIIERTDFSIGELGQVNTIQRLYPRIQGGSKVFIQIGSQQVPGGAITWKPAVEYDPGASRKIDIRATGPLHAYRIFVDDVKADFTLSGLDIEFVPAGLR